MTLGSAAVIILIWILVAVPFAAIAGRILAAAKPRGRRSSRRGAFQMRHR